MPWDCIGCSATCIGDSFPCPECGAIKSSWTMVANQTRAITVTRGRAFRLQRSDAPGEPRAQDAGYGDTGRVKAKTAPAISKAQALQLSEQGQLPAPGQIVFARLTPKADQDLALKVYVHYETAEVGELDVPGPESPELDVEGGLEVPLLCVYGPEPLPEGVAFPGVHVIDVSEESSQGYAPTVGVAALGKKRKDLPIELTGARLILWDQGQTRRLAFHEFLLFHGDTHVLTAECDAQGEYVLDGELPEDWSVDVVGPGPSHPIWEQAAATSDDEGEAEELEEDEGPDDEQDPLDEGQEEAA